VSGFLDTSMVVRYLTGDPPHLAEQADPGSSTRRRPYR
jgi:hypothetical protein